MKYFTQELLDKMDEDKDSDYKKTMEQWMNNLRDYWHEFESFKNFLPDNLAKLFSSSFHDAHINKISLQQDGISYDLIISMAGVNFCGNLINKGVIEYTTTITDIKNCGKIGDYRYGEIFKENHGWTHNFIFFNNSEVFVRCDKLYWVDNLL